MKLKILIIILFALSFFNINAGTLIYRVKSQKEPQVLSKISIVSIEKNTITLKQGKGIRTIPLSYMISYYDTDIEVSNFADNTAEYKISVRKIEMPESGYEYKRNSKTKRKTKKTSECEIEFSINKKIDKNTSKNIRMPYFYLYVLTSNTKTYGRRPVYTYYYPKEAKIQSKTYDKAQIIEAIKSMERPRIYDNGKSDFGNDTHKLSAAGDAHTFSIELKGIKDRPVIAYYLEVWGKDGIIYQKTWHNVKYSVSKEWWRQY